MSDKNKLQFALVDDNEIELFLMRKFINMAGFTSEEQVKSFSSGPDALTEFEKNSVPDVLLLDIQMPVMDGFAFLDSFSEILAQKKLSSCIIMISSTLDFGDISRAEAHPLVTAFVEKPLKPELLRQILQREDLL